MTNWFNRRPGDVACEASEDSDEPGTLLFMAPGAAPDHVRLPPELGGRELCVLGHHVAECPRCHVPGQRHLELADSYGVAECLACAFVWYRLK
jgi:hypothetical protein